MTIANALQMFPLRTELERIAEAAASRPRTVADVEADLLRHHGFAVGAEHSLRELWRIRRAVQARHGMTRLDGWGKSERNVFLLKSKISALRAERAKIAGLNAEVDAIEPRR